ncbi:hypothetical protein P4O66_006421, partial [Electrophorus voltai]
FITDKDHVQFVLSLLTGEAGAWGTTLWVSQDPTLHSETEFYNLVKAVFNHPTELSCRGESTTLSELIKLAITVENLRRTHQPLQRAPRAHTFVSEDSDKRSGGVPELMQVSRSCLTP